MNNDLVDFPVPIIKNIHQKVFEAASQPGALNMNRWHCGTAHCRAGWVIHLTGQAGHTLAQLLCGTANAASAIYAASSPIPVVETQFYVSNIEALADMKRCAEEEIALNLMNAGPNKEK